MSRPKTTCTLDGCDRTHRSNGFCEMHFTRWKRNGDPHRIQRLRRAARDVVDGVHHKQCTMCFRMLPLEAAYTRSAKAADGYRSQCDECYAPKIRENRLIKVYGITASEYDDMNEAQGGLCAICRQPDSGTDKRTGGPRQLCVDHDHRTGVVRGLLCNNCNTAIGLLRDDPVIAISASNYLANSLAVRPSTHN